MSDPVLTVLMLTQPSRDKIRAAAWAALCGQTDVNMPVEVLVLADDDCNVCTLPGWVHGLPTPAWAQTRVVKATWAGPGGSTPNAVWPTLTDKLNAGFQLAKAPSVTFWDDDDWAEPWRIAKTIDALADRCADIYGPATMIRHELVAPTRHTFLYTSPWGLPCLNGAVIYRDLVVRRPFKPLHAKPHEHNVGAWLLDQQKDPATTFATIDVDIVAMAHAGGVNHPTQYRVDPVNGRVLDGAEYKLIGGRAEVSARMGADLLRFEAAVGARP